MHNGGKGGKIPFRNEARVPWSSPSCERVSTFQRNVFPIFAGRPMPVLIVSKRAFTPVRRFTCRTEPL